MATLGEFAQASLPLALPLIALPLGNSVLATKQVVADLFPYREPLTVRRFLALSGRLLVGEPVAFQPLFPGRIVNTLSWARC